VSVSRRQFVAGTAGLGMLAGCGRLPWQTAPPAAVKIYSLGFLHGGNPIAEARTLGMFRQALSELGYVEGQNLAIEYRWGDGSIEQLAEPAAELARLPVDVFVVPSGQVAQIAREATTTVPIVLAGAIADPVAAGLATSYARPGGNVTGITNGGSQLVGKRLQLLKEAAPSISRVAIFWDAATLGRFPAEAWGRDAEAVGVQLHSREVRSIEDFDAAFDKAAQAGADALIGGPGPLFVAHRGPILQFVARHRWPAMYDQRQIVEEGGLMAYTASLTDRWQRTASHVDKILKGGNPAEIPFEQPTRFDFLVTLKTAQALGITFPHEIMLQVTEVIQ
jgi:putative ABC transport system substrate-binding protein